MEQNSTPSPSPNEEICRLLNESRLTFDTDGEEQVEVLSIGDSAIGTLGNFSASIGKAKSKKTFNVSAIVAAALTNGTVLNYRASFPDDKRKILYIDTEQSRCHCLKVMKRILALAGLPTDELSGNLDFLMLRKYSPSVRILMVEEAIRQTDGLGLVVIDGLRDLVVDINCPSESTAIISKMMQWTDERQIHIHTVLHQNKSDDNARGHIGTELNNKAETILQVEKDKMDTSISSVEPVHVRAMEFDSFAFRINSDGLPELVENYVSSKPKVGRPSKTFDPATDIPEDGHRMIVDAVFCEGQTYGYADLEAALTNAYQMHGHKLNHNKMTNQVIPYLRDQAKLIRQDGARSPYRRNIAVPTVEEQDLPF